ncbi:MAG TPA: hypothetical protein VKF59_08955 [Candidatus Dormibacteraeota bacterium]|nr:hypothetical protein [Candidatus Dormibacteraeota bacterium]
MITTRSGDTFGPASSRPEIAAVLLLLQAGAWLLAAVSALPFAVGGEPTMLVPAALTMGLVSLALLLAAGLGGRRRWARSWALALEWTCLLGSLLQLALPIGTPRGLVALMVDVGLPVALLALLMGRRGRVAFGAVSRPEVALPPQ